MENENNGFRSKIDRYLRREDTSLARALKKISSKRGQEYRESLQKRATEILISTPLAIASLPVLAVLATAKKLEDGRESFYIQKRVSKNGTVDVVKIRCMRNDSDKDIAANLHNALNFGEGSDPRNTLVGNFMRKYNLEEVPQLWQIVKGELSLVELRAAPQYVLDYLKKEDPIHYQAWEKAYMRAERPGVISLNGTLNRTPKDDKLRYRYDLLYSKKANLGLDLYILYRTSAKILGKLLK